MLECIQMGVKFVCCDLAAKIIGLDKSELMEGVIMGPSSTVADLLLEYQEEGQLIISL
jgi:predicted peroxiredoxin